MRKWKGILNDCRPPQTLMCVCVILRGIVDDDVLYIRGGVGSILIIPSATPPPPPRARSKHAPFNSYLRDPGEDMPSYSRSRAPFIP